MHPAAQPAPNQSQTKAATAAARQLCFRIPLRSLGVDGRPQVGGQRRVYAKPSEGDGPTARYDIEIVGVEEGSPRSAQESATRARIGHSGFNL